MQPYRIGIVSTFGAGTAASRGCWVLEVIEVIEVIALIELDWPGPAATRRAATVVYCGGTA